MKLAWSTAHFHIHFTLDTSESERGKGHQVFVRTHPLYMRPLVFSLGLHVGNVRVENVHLSNHSCVFFEHNVPPEPRPVPIRAERRIITETTAGPWVTRMFNLSLSSGVFPCTFMHAIVEPKLKKLNLDQSDLKNFRPISKLHFLAKMLEKVVSAQLTSFLE